MSLEAAWTSHLGIGQPTFPREVAFPLNRGGFSRRVVYNPNEYVELLHVVAPGRNVYTSLYSEEQIRRSQLDKIYLDIDAPNIEEAYGYMRGICQASQHRYGKQPRVYLTGAKGFAVYFDFEQSFLQPRAAREWALRLADEAQARLDAHVLGDVRRVSRVPYTYNFNALHKLGAPGFCVPVDPVEPLPDMVSESKHPSEVLDIAIETFQEVPGEVTELGVCEPQRMVAPISVGRATERLGALMALSGRIRDGRHRILHFVAVPLLVASGATLEQTRAWCRSWVEATGKSYLQYDRYVQNSYRRHVLNGWGPWGMDKLLHENMDILGGILSD